MEEQQSVRFLGRKLKRYKPLGKDRNLWQPEVATVLYASRGLLAEGSLETFGTFTPESFGDDRYTEPTVCAWVFVAKNVAYVHVDL